MLSPLALHSRQPRPGEQSKLSCCIHLRTGRSSKPINGSLTKALAAAPSGPVCTRWMTSVDALAAGSPATPRWCPTTWMAAWLAVRSLFSNEAASRWQRSSCPSAPEMLVCTALHGDAAPACACHLGPTACLLLPARACADFGFDPLGLGSSPEQLSWNVHAEIFHGRLAMTGCAGILLTSVSTPGSRGCAKAAASR